MEYRVNFGFQAFAVPSAVVDNLIRLAKENHLKVLLYLLRHPEQNFTSAQIANYLYLDEELAEEALEFWKSANILQEASQETLASENYTFAFTVPTTDTPASTTTPEEKPISEPENKLTEHVVLKPSRNTSEELSRLSNQDIKEMIENSTKLKNLILQSKAYFKRDQNAIEIRSLVWMHDYLGMNNEVILILLEYCSMIDKLNIRYIDKIAYSWWEDEILTEEAARKQVQSLKEFYTYTMYIKRLFEMDSNPTKSQKEFIERWQYAGYSEELLLYAHDLTVEAICKKNFKYIDKILQGWSDAGITKLEQAKKAHESFVKELEKGRKSKKGKPKNTLSKEKLEGYLSLVNRFKED